MAELHYIQMRILRDLLFSPTLSFSQLNNGGLSTDHFSYHTQTLIKLGYVEKSKQGYSLSLEGKLFATNISIENAQINKPPKVSVVVIGTRTNNDADELLILKRLKNPFYGLHGFITGKVQWGETVEGCAKRELLEETGLRAQQIKYKYTIHEHVLTESGVLIEDKIFFVFLVHNLQGTLKKTPEGDPFWMALNEFRNDTNRFYDMNDLYNWAATPPEGRFIEKTYVVDEDLF